MLKLSLLIDVPPSSGLGGGSGFGVVYLGRYERGRRSGILTCFGAGSGELRSSKAEVMSTAIRPWLAESFTEDEDELSELSWMMRVFIVRDVAVPLDSELRLRWGWMLIITGECLCLAKAVVMMWSEVNGRWEGIEEQKILFMSRGKLLDRSLTRSCRLSRQERLRCCWLPRNMRSQNAGDNHQFTACAAIKTASEMLLQARYDELYAAV